MNNSYDFLFLLIDDELVDKSKSKLIKNILMSCDSKVIEYKDYIENRDLKIVEEIRNESYPIFQDNHGTHIFREKALESYKEIVTLSEHLDVFIIDGIFKDTEYLLETVSNYRLILSEKSIHFAEEISASYSQNHDSGFLYKKTQYDKV